MELVKMGYAVEDECVQWEIFAADNILQNKQMKTQYFDLRKLSAKRNLFSTSLFFILFINNLNDLQYVGRVNVVDRHHTITVSRTEYISL